jgi:hypothetical protein
MKVSVKTISFIFLALMIIFLTGWYASDYYGSTYSPIITGAIMRIVCGVTLFIQIVVCIVAWIRKHHRCMAAIVLVLLFGLNVVGDTMPYHNDLILSGLRDRILRDYGIEALKHFAVDFDRTPPLEKYRMMLPVKIYKSEDLSGTKLVEKYHFLELYNSLGYGGPNFVTESDGVVDVSWGGRPHWGFRISVDGKALGAPITLGAKVLHVSDDIYFVLENGD